MEKSGWLSIGLFALLMGAPVLIMERQVVARTEVLLDGHSFNIIIKRNHSLTVNEGISTGANIHKEEGKLVATRGIWGGRGRLPIFYTVPATAQEAKLYRMFF